MKTKFKDLSWPLKIGVIGGWIAIVVYALSFILGFFEGLVGY